MASNKGLIKSHRLHFVAAMIPLVLFLFLFQNCSTNSGDSSAPQEQKVKYPSQLNFSNVGTLGIFDPSLAQASGSSQIWMSYSAVNASAMWPTQNTRVVSTRLASSVDQGNTWADFGSVVNNVLDVNITVLSSPNNAGTWINEVSDLVYDPGASAGQQWKLIWHHYLIINNQRQLNNHAWIALKTAASPDLLASATEIKLFSSFGYDSANNTQGGTTDSPVGGAPAIALDTALSSQLNGCIFTEPGMLATSSALYLSLLCAKSSTNHQIALFKCQSPCNTTNAGSWTYLGAALVDSDAAALGFNEGFSATNLVSSGGQNYLIVTPVSTTPFDSYYSGCQVFKFTNIDTATLQRTNGVPVVITTVNGDWGSFNGACSYLPGASKAGVIYSQLFPNDPVQFRIFKSGVNF